MHSKSNLLADILEQLVGNRIGVDWVVEKGGKRRYEGTASIQVFRGFRVIWACLTCVKFTGRPNFRLLVHFAQTEGSWRAGHPCLGIGCGKAA